jgi:phage terminase large subunit-like protein
MIPKDSIVDVSLSNGVRDAIDSLHVRHISGGTSIIRFKSYEQGRAKFQGEGLDWIWFDEEPPMDIYSEGLTRIGDRHGVAWMTFTPIDGPTAVVLRFTDEPSPQRAIVGMTLDDVPPGGHLTADDKAKMEASYLPHEREARARGIPMLGSGRIFTTTEAMIAEAPIEYVPLHWKKLWGVDFGINHPFAAVLVLWEEPDGADIIHVHQTIRMTDALTAAHADAMKRVAASVPVAWPHDGGERDRNTGEPLATSYRRLGLHMLPSHAAWEDGSFSTEAGILEWDEREKTGRLKVARHLSDWFEERRIYHRKDGKIVKIKDDLMSATRIALMAKRFARAVSLGSVDMRERERAPQVARNVDFDVFTGRAYDDASEGLARNVEFDVFA